MKENKTLWIILGIIAVIIIMNNQGQGLFVTTTPNCLSTQHIEPLDFRDYITPMEDLYGNDCYVTGESSAKGVVCSNGVDISISFIEYQEGYKDRNPCSNMYEKFDKVQTFNDVDIFYPKDLKVTTVTDINTGETSSYHETYSYSICSKYDRVIISNNLAWLIKYIDYYTCKVYSDTTSSSSSSGGTTNSGSTTGIDLPKTVDTTPWYNQLILGIPLWAIAIIGIVLLALLTKQWWLLIIAPIIFFFVLKANGIVGMGVG